MEQAFISNEAFRKIELFISCRGLKDRDTFSKSDPLVKFSQRNLTNNSLEFLGKTETVKDNLNPNFTKSFIVQYIFEVKQDVTFEVIDDDGKDSEFIGVCNTTIGDIVGARQNTFIKNIHDPKTQKETGKIIIRSEKVEDCNDEIFMQWSAKKLKNTDGWFGDSDPFLRFFRNRGEEGNDFVKVHETEVIMDNLNPTWKPFQVKSQKFCNGDYLRPLKIECWDWEKNQKFQYIGETQISINMLINKQVEFDLFDVKKKKKTGTLHLQQFQLFKNPSFLDYISGGVQLNLILAVDFTGSNGVVSNPQSLHYLNPGGNLNQYQGAILSVGEILLAYDYDKNVSAFGFGAKCHFPQMTTNQVMHCFPLTGNPQQLEVQGIQGIMQTYQYSQQCVELSGPTYFAPLIGEAMKVAQHCKTNGSIQYEILLIITDGEIHDMQATIDLIVHCSELPISIIIVGVGEADFSKMEILGKLFMKYKIDGDGGLTSSTFKKATRDLVQFVPFRNMKGNPFLLAKHVLAEIPDQVVQYYKSQGIEPKKQQFLNV